MKLNSQLTDKFIIIICLTLFSYQSITLLKAFMKGKTVVNIAIGETFNDSLPAITVCPGSLAIDKMATINEKYSNFFIKYQQFINSTTAFTHGMVEQYYSINSNVLQDIKNGALDLDIYNLMKNYTHPYNSSHRTLDAKVLSNYDTTNNEDVDYVNHNSNPIEGFTLDLQLWKCFTFFSHLDKRFKKIQISFRHIVINLSLNENTYPHVFYPFPIIMHSPNHLPTMESGRGTLVRQNRVYIVQYYQIRIERLGPGFDTNCKDYDDDQNFSIRSDCLLACHQKYHDAMCNTTGIIESAFLLREQFTKAHRNYRPSSCHRYHQRIGHIIASCSFECPKECHFTYYALNLVNLAKFQNSSTIIAIMHNEMPDLYIKYVPEINFISFVCNFGGLLGMWLGFSFLKIIKRLKSFLVKFVRRHLRLKQDINIINIKKLYVGNDDKLFVKRKIIPIKMIFRDRPC